MSKNHDKKKVVEIDQHITKRFEIKKRIGKGAYGIVWKAVDRRSREVVALKKIYDAFRNPTDAQRTFREIMLLQAFKEHPNIVTLFSIHKALNNQDIYLGFEYMETDLHNVIKKGNILKDVHKRYIMYQMLCATRYIHSGNVIHRDQKPSNVLLDSNCRAKIADFGLARSVDHRDDVDGSEVDPSLTNYVATRWYRAPEILTASKKYSKAVDMWSLGCILGEMLKGKPLFQGSSTVNQVEKIMAALPKPSQEDIASVCSGYGSALVSTPPAPSKSLSAMFDGCPQDAADLVQSLIVFNPNHRLTAQLALEHPYVQRFYKEQGVMVMPYHVVPPLRDDVQLKVEDYRNTLYDFINAGPTGLVNPGSAAGRLHDSRKQNVKSSLPVRPHTQPRDDYNHYPVTSGKEGSSRHNKDHHSYNSSTYLKKADSKQDKNGDRSIDRSQDVVRDVDLHNAQSKQSLSVRVHNPKTIKRVVQMDRQNNEFNENSKRQAKSEHSNHNGNTQSGLKMPNSRKSHLTKPQKVHSEPKMYFKEQYQCNDRTKDSTKTGPSGGYGDRKGLRPVNGISQVNLTKTANIQRSKIPMSENSHGDHINNNMTKGGSGMIGSYPVSVHNRRSAPDGQMATTPVYVNPFRFNGQPTYKNSHSNNSRYSYGSGEGNATPTFYRHKQYGVITASALMELARDHSGVR